MSASPTTFACLAAPECVLSLRQVSKQYGKDTVVDQVSLQVGKGEIFGLLGPNGAGKTTLIKMIAGLSRPNAGSLDFFADGKAIAMLERNRFIGLVPQESNLERELTVEEALLLYARLFAVNDPHRRVEELMQEFNLTAIRNKKVGLLSGGMARRALIARVLLPQPQLLLLDEPTVGLDPDVRQDIWQIVRDLAAAGKTILMTTHYMDEAEALCHRIALLKAGRIAVTGTPETLKALAANDTAEPQITLEKAFLQLIREESV
ncbi:ABC transporter ATP-binding protein [Sporomusa acidovorans]|uniref:Linearmycin resistance ATP-binding protein LnrL n=1 Tax=Sporomusa acidovorans (strain ATCC 49682 / DSM 3132 / Mol) TaxID=1123286 RepID=A0ABZ3JAQ7_SPOA4|nr:ABC transporter ATP-binding protein [Sporomusa acidovorans]OZC17356.1 putative ABC transporter ATP-binding protein YbhF [Sporomusa acidovorans DSM 3132]SDF45936.1 ABC-2 type transport system ATP-binding protein [Sporomusa acidovorans]